jgi:hypothetical protein
MTTDRRSCAVSFLQDRDCSPAGETRMNANNSFRTSITILTFATLIGCVVVLFSGLSMSGLRPAANDKAMVSTADQKLRNRFGEFYPAEPRVSTTATHSSSPNAIHTVSQSTDSDEETTTTSDDGYAEVVTSWSSGSSIGTPQVSVPVTINVNNGELMAQLIETRESLAEVKARQSAIHQEQRVFSYQVHKKENGTSVETEAGAATPGDSAVQVVHDESSSEKPEGSAVASSETSKPSSKQVSRIRPVAADTTSRQTKTEKNQSKLSSGEVSAVESAQPVQEKSNGQTTPATSVSETFEFETNTETKSTSAEQTTEFRIEEEVSFESMTLPATPAPAEDHSESVPVIEPISYNVEEIESSSTDTSEEPVVQFAPLDEPAVPSDAPAQLPELSFQPSQPSLSPALPVLSIQDDSADEEAFVVDEPDTLSEKAPTEPRLPDLSATAEPPVSPSEVKTENSASPSQTTKVNNRSREQLATTFSAVRGLPPEDLFGVRTTPEALSQPSTSETASSSLVAESKSISTADSVTAKTTSESDLPTISFIESTGDGLVVHPISAASPVELEYGEPSTPTPALAGNEVPGRPETPAMLPAEEKPERWHKYRSRIHRNRSSAPSSPVPPVPQIAQSEAPQSPTISSQEPALVPPAPENKLAESGSSNLSSDNPTSDYPLLIPDVDGTTEVAQNGDSEKLSSSALPPVPELPAVAPSQVETNAQEVAEAPVYVPQPLMDRLGEVNTELSTYPIVSSPPTMAAPRKFPQKSSGGPPFATTIRRINKRVANIAGAMKLPERKIAQNKPAPPKSPTIVRPQPSPPKLSQRQAHAVEKKNSVPAIQMPKLAAPKFTVHNFSLPKVNFRAIPAPSLRMPALDTPDWLACPPNLMAPVSNSTTLHRMISTMQFAGQPQVLN